MSKIITTYWTAAKNPQIHPVLQLVFDTGRSVIPPQEQMLTIPAGAAATLTKEIPRPSLRWRDICFIVYRTTSILRIYTLRLDYIIYVKSH